MSKVSAGVPRVRPSSMMTKCQTMTTKGDERQEPLFNNIQSKGIAGLPTWCTTL